MYFLSVRLLLNDWSLINWLHVGQDLLPHGLMSLFRYSLRGLMTISVVFTKHFFACNWFPDVWNRDESLCRCLIIDFILKLQARWQNYIIWWYKTFLGWSSQRACWHFVSAWWILSPLEHLHIFPQLHIIPGQTLKELVLLAALDFVLGLDLALVARLQLLILQSFQAVLGAFFFLFPSISKVVKLTCVWRWKMQDSRLPRGPNIHQQRNPSSSRK